MKVLIVANYNKGHFSPFVLDQMQALRKEGVVIETFGKVGNGSLGYLRNLLALRRKIQSFKPDLVHAHYGLCGLLANLQRLKPVVTTYHGSDIHSGKWLPKLSRIAMRLSAYNIFVSEGLLKLSGYKKGNACVQPCGIDLDVIQEIPRAEARKALGLDNQKKIGLFSGSFDNQIKDAPLAKAAVEKLPGVELMELRGYSRKEVGFLMNACDFQLTTSFRESGPLVVKEAMACGTPVVSVDVGDVREVMGNTSGCYIAERNADDIAKKIRLALNFREKTDGRQRIIGLRLDNKDIALRIVEIYQQVLQQC